jgi:5-methyltetrahydrofolate--homocysteine methyltransferase
MATVRGNVREQLEHLLFRRMLVLDGAMGCMLYARVPREEDYRRTRFRNHPVRLKNCTEVMALTQPKLIEDIHRAYLEAGADIIETDTFNGNALSLAEFGLQEHVFELNKAAAEIARRAADDFTRRDPDRPRFVAGSIGPTNKVLSLAVHVEDPARRDVTFDDLVAGYPEQVRGLAAGGVDLLL